MPGLKKLLRRWRSPRVREHSIDAPITSREDVERWAMWSRHGEKVVLHVPVERLVMQGALRYADTASHPFLRALDEGASALQAYYAQRQPRSFCEFYGVSPTVAADEQVPCWELPWLHRLRRVPPPGEAGLGAEHGVSYYGPASPRKVEVEYQRLASLKQRVLRMGYLPEVYGHIVGFFMLDDAGEYRFFVRGGKHRTAVLAHLGHRSIPVTFKPDWPRMVRERDAAYWPLVEDGVLSETVARAAFRRYTGPGWPWATTTEPERAVEMA